MRERESILAGQLKQPWILAVLFAAFIPLFPEYFAPILAACSLIAAYKENSLSHRVFQIGTIGKIVLIYMAYMTFGLLYSPHFLSTLASIGMWLSMLMVYVAITSVLTDRERFDTAIFIVCLLAGIVGFIGCVQYVLKAVLHLNISNELWSFFDYRVLDFFQIQLKSRIQELRVSSTFNNPNLFAEVMVMYLPFLAYYSFCGRKKNFHLLMRFCLMAAIGGIAFSLSRGSYIALLAIAFVFCIANIRKITLLVVALSSGLLLIPQPFITRLYSITGSDSSVDQRLSIWKYSVHLIKVSPVFGYGAGVENSWTLLLQKGINAPHMHNLILQLFIEGGIIAVILFAVMGWKMLNYGVSMLSRDHEAKMIGVLILSFIVGFVVNSLFEFPLLTPKLVGVFIMVVAFSESASRIYLGKLMTPLRDVFSFQKDFAEAQSEHISFSNAHNSK